MALKYNLDRQVTFGEETEYKSLYTWFLQEQDETGKLVGEKQIPWSWNLIFSAIEVELTDSFSIQVHSIFRLLDNEEENKKDPPPKIEDRSCIHAKLRPGYLNASSYRKERYFMFGTDREVTSFDLWISKVDEGKEESCYAWGSPSYETGDFDGADEDTLQFYLRVKPERFVQYAAMIQQFPVNV